MAYCVVQDLDLRNYGFGKWNTFHTGNPDLNQAFEQMYDHHDFSNPSFAITTPTLLTNHQRDCPPDCQIVEFLTVANYEYFKQLQATDAKAYRQKNQKF
ncbi:hypothetical protein DO97_20635 [Neosynechococcus sphagnicola sy1]|uniref:Uncharacterized protein n=1 Tax=Neosynechococcus sphagnicola sy1 TaxID=1497020 RepID=A0A098TH49_9CYAN|nr:hypothetical protein [Neosynechococcus sphagnicola]KGF71414.1 hypothetical protein DO97_20635 [Neosynechococcus sphagnicola sy1]